MIVFCGVVAWLVCGVFATWLCARYNRHILEDYHGNVLGGMCLGVTFVGALSLFMILFQLFVDGLGTRFVEWYGDWIAGRR